MLRKVLAALLLAGLAVAGTSLAAAAEPSFDLKVRVDLPPEVTSQLRTGDTLQLVLRPQVQFGERTVQGQPVVLEKTWRPGTVVETMRFDEALTADQIYSLEMRVVRPDDRGEAEQVRYVSALWKLPLKPVDHGIRVRMHLAHERDTRDNNVLITRGSDGVYRVMLFFA
jgi:hypothetical protein